MGGGVGGEGGGVYIERFLSLYLSFFCSNHCLQLPAKNVLNDPLYG